MLQKLKSMATRLTDGSDQNITPVLPKLVVFRWNEDASFEGVVYNPAVCIVLKGRKEFTLNNETISHSAGDAFVISHDMPISSRIREAAPGDPYLSLIMTLDMGILRSVYDQVGPTVVEDTSAKSLASGTFDMSWAEPLYRYLCLADNPLEAEVLGPLTLREIHFKLLVSPLGGMLRNLCFADSKASKISKAIQHLKLHFREPIAMSDLAKVASMSTSSFFDHFKTVTGKTPLQYQKDLRLIEAQNLLLSGEWTVSSAGLEVGYESPSHFSRDYARKHGCSPKHHLARARGVVEKS